MISMICAVGKNLAIGRDNKLIWDLPNDLKHFRDITAGHTVIMGDRTFESIGRPLPGRKNIVVSLLENYEAPGCEVRNSLEEVLDEYKNKEEEVFVIGGATIYRLSLPYADKLYLTLVDDAPADADAFFPDYSEFTKEILREEREENGIKYAFVELVK
jgi:dihydrofolate reductase